MLLARVIETSAQVAATRSRNTKVALLAATLRDAAEGGSERRAGADDTAAGRELEVVADYLAGTVPQRRVGVSWRGVQQLPEPAAGPSWTVLELDAALTALAGLRGPGSARARAEEVRRLMARATEQEQHWLRGLLTGEVRQGAGDGVVLRAVAEAAGVPETAVRRAVMLAGFPGPVARAALLGGQDALAAVGLRVGRPLRPMLAAAAPTVTEAVTRAGGPVAVESKLDGIRVQAHRSGEEVQLFTRSLEEVTERLPEVVEVVAALPGGDLVLDGEVVAVGGDGRPQPFQVTGARTASTADPDRLRAEVPLTTFLFDLLHQDGEDLVDLPTAERWQRLAALAPAHLVPRTVTDEPGVAERFAADRVAEGHEGVVVKDLVAPYAAGRRGAGWVKVKPRHTLDLVVLAVEWGSGRRRGWLSNIHLGARDEATGEPVMLGKTFKGMSDRMLRWQTDRFLALETHREGHVVHVRPEQVVEVAFDGVQASRRYPGGVALRFARVLRYRDDKPVEEVDTVQQVRRLGGLSGSGAP